MKCGRSGRTVSGIGTDESRELLAKDWDESGWDRAKSKVGE